MDLSSSDDEYVASDDDDSDTSDEEDDLLECITQSRTQKILLQRHREILQRLFPNDKETV